MSVESSATSEVQQDLAAKNGNPWSSGWRSWLVFGAIAITLYFGNVQLQTYLGQQALEKLSYTPLTLQEALQQAEKQSKLVLADMSAIWCPSCRRLDAEVLSDAGVNRAVNEKYVFVRIEYESEAGKAFQQQYGVRGFPTLLVLNPQGEKLHNIGLTFDKQEFIRRL